MSNNLQFTIVGNGDEKNITVFIPGRAPLVAHSSHPNFARITELVIAGDESVADLFDVAQTVGVKFERLSERVTTKHGRLFLDGEEVDNALSGQVVRFLQEGVEDWKPLVRFFENVQQNPQEHSREQLFNWLQTEDFTITKEGMIVGYKGVTSDLKSINQGKAIVDGEEQNGRISNHIGAIVEMPRSEVTWDPSIGCHRGLHVGTYGYAKSFAQGALLEVEVHPRDVVSVPNDSSYQKMRVCRYKVIGTTDLPYTSAIRPYDYEQEDDLEWGEYDEDYYTDEPADGSLY